MSNGTPSFTFAEAWQQVLSETNTTPRGAQLCSMSLREHVTRILPEDAMSRYWVDRFFSEYEEILANFSRYTAIQRTKRLRQLGIQSNREAGHVYSHTRWNHSNINASMVLALGIHHGWPFIDIISAVIAALWHDVGHSAYGHNADHAIVASGAENHEERSQVSFSRNRGVRRQCEKIDIEVNGVVEIMREQGPYGIVQALMDTASWVELDMAMIGRPLPEDFAWKLISSIVRLEEGRVVVNDDKPIRQLLELRAWLMRNMYRSSRGKICNGAVVALLTFGFTNELIDLEELTAGVDADLDDHMSALFGGDNGVPDWARSAWKLARGDVEQLQAWEVRSFEDASKYRRARTFLNGSGGYLQIPTYDYAKKVIRARTVNGKDLDLKASGDFSLPIDRQNHLLMYRG